MSLKQLHKDQWIQMAHDILAENPYNKELKKNLIRFISDATRGHYHLLSTGWILNTFNAYCIPNFRYQWDDRHESIYLQR